MADIKYLYGNPIKDGFAVHFPVSADAPVYPSKKSNVTIDTDGTMGYGSADETVLIAGTDVFFASGYINPSTGAWTNSGTRSTSLDKMTLNSEYITTSDTEKVSGFCIHGYDSEGQYVGAWNPSTQTWTETTSYSEEIDTAAIVEKYPNYTFRITAARVSTVTNSDVRRYLQFGFKKDNYTAIQSEGTSEAILFDTSGITVIDSAYILGFSAFVAEDDNYVCTDYIDISNRIGDTIKFNCTVRTNPIGFTVFDKGKKPISGAYGNMAGLSDYGLVARNEPQNITWNLRKDAYYIRATMLKSFYSEPSDFGFKFYVSAKGNEAKTSYNRNFITIAHKGYGNANIANTLQSAINAAEAGFKAIEIDCRKTSDGVWVVAHNDVNTLYNNGTAVSVTISSSTWASIRGLTVNNNSEYHLATLVSMFNTLKRYNVDFFILDRKVGTNAELMEVAGRCGAVDHVMLSYYSMESLVADLDTLKKYPTVAIRVDPDGTQEQWNQIRAAIPNKIYADINISDSSKNTRYPKSFAWKIPILCSGVTADNAVVMAPVAAGAMSNLTLQFSPMQFIEMVSLDFGLQPTLTASTDNISISGTGTQTVTVTTDIDDPACWAFAYSDDLTVFEVTQTAFGDTATITITGVSAGTANLIVFSATGEQLIIPVTVT